MQLKFQNIFKSEWLFIRLILYILFIHLIINTYNFWPTIFGGEFSEEVTPPSVILNSIEISTPTKILIPRINLTAKIVPVGKTMAGNLDVPKSLVNTGWYKLGIKPGEKGNAVIDGHEVDSLGLGAIFKNLYLLKTGDQIIIENENSEKLFFSIIKTEIYDYGQAPLNEIFGPSETRNLNLITCEGDYVTKLATKNKRLVVYSIQI